MASRPGRPLAPAICVTYFMKSPLPSVSLASSFSYCFSVISPFSSLSLSFATSSLSLDTSMPFFFATPRKSFITSRRGFIWPLASYRLRPRALMASLVSLLGFVMFWMTRLRLVPAMVLLMPLLAIRPRARDTSFRL